MRKIAFLAATTAIFIPGLGTAQPAPQQVYRVTITAQQAGIIGTALGERPFKEVAGLIYELQRQISEQDNAKQPPKPDHAPEPEPQKPQ